MVGDKDDRAALHQLAAQAAVIQMVGGVGIN
jgi:hypothetical protein